MDLSKLSREDLMVGGGGLVLLIGLLAFPWFSTHPFGYHYTTAAIDGPGSAWAIIALIILFWVLVDLGLARFSPATVILPATKYGRELTRSVAIAAIVALMAIRVLWHLGDWGWGFFADLILLALVAVGAWFNATGRRTPLSPRAS